jgi:solute carrier family 25 (mitochondrial carnitine/acylcarnitine transporter), member 20/29
MELSVRVASFSDFRRRDFFSVLDMAEEHVKKSFVKKKMTHNEKRKEWWKEGLIGLVTGILYGTTSVAVGQPFDTLKTKMQAQKSFVEKGGMLKSFQKVISTEGGFLGLYKGSLPPLIGSGVYRSIQFAVFEALYTKWSKYDAEIPYSGGLEYRVIAAGASASTVRSIIESPIEFVKVKRQTLQNWKAIELWNGYPLQWARTSGVMITYFSCIDSIRRHYPETFKTIWGQFMASSCAATLGFWRKNY